MIETQISQMMKLLFKNLGRFHEIHLCTQFFLIQGNPGLLNEFYVKMQGENEVKIESFVYGFLSRFQEGKIIAQNEMSDCSIIRTHAKVCQN